MKLVITEKPSESYDERYGKWQYEDLPIRPKDWRYQVSASTRKQLSVLKKLMERQDVTGLVCDRRRTRGRADLPPGLLRKRLPQAVRATLDFFHGGYGDP